MKFPLDLPGVRLIPAIPRAVVLHLQRIDRTPALHQVGFGEANAFHLVIPETFHQGHVLAHDVPQISLLRGQHANRNDCKLEPDFV